MTDIKLTRQLVAAFQSDDGGKKWNLYNIYLTSYSMNPLDPWYVDMEQGYAHRVLLKDTKIVKVSKDMIDPDCVLEHLAQSAQDEDLDSKLARAVENEQYELASKIKKEIDRRRGVEVEEEISSGSADDQ